MNAIYHAIYVAVFLAYARKIMYKCTVAFNLTVHVENRNADADEYFIFVNDNPFYWANDLDDIKAFYYTACSRAPSLARKMKIVQDDKEYALRSSDSCGLTLEECCALDQTVDEFE